MRRVGTSFQAFQAREIYIYIHAHRLCVCRLLAAPSNYVCVYINLQRAISLLREREREFWAGSLWHSRVQRHLEHECICNSSSSRDPSNGKGSSSSECEEKQIFELLIYAVLESAGHGALGSVGSPTVLYVWLYIYGVYYTRLPMPGNTDDTVEKPRAEREWMRERVGTISDRQGGPAASTAQCGGSHWLGQKKK